MVKYIEQFGHSYYQAKRGECTICGSTSGNNFNINIDGKNKEDAKMLAELYEKSTKCQDCEELPGFKTIGKISIELT